MEIAPYRIDDRSACLRLFRSNVPRYFAASDEDAFAQFLDASAAPFWVARDGGEVCACGGVALDHPEPNVATLCWGMVAASVHRRGIGSALLDFRIRMIATDHPSIARVRINTTQRVQAFYERHAFVLCVSIPTDMAADWTMSSWIGPSDERQREATSPTWLRHLCAFCLTQ